MRPNFVADLWSTTNRSLVAGFLVIASGLFGGCNQNMVYPVTSGTHASIDPVTQKEFALASAERKLTFVIVADDPELESAISQRLLRAPNARLIERTKLDQVLNEKALQQTLGTNDQSKWIEVGKIVGAEVLVFAEHRSTEESRGAYRLSVTVRSVAVETGEVRWSGSALFPRPINNPQQALSILAMGAVSRATCLVESGWEWTEAGPFVKKPGCNKKQ